MLENATADLVPEGIRVDRRTGTARSTHVATIFILPSEYSYFNVTRYSHHVKSTATRHILGKFRLERIFFRLVKR